MLLVGHDAFPAGSQELLLQIGRTLLQETGTEVEFLLGSGGALEQAYRAVAPTRFALTGADLAESARRFAERGFTAALVNSFVACPAVPTLEAAGIATVLLFHELPGLIRQRQGGELARIALSAARRVVFPAPFVRDAVVAELGLPEDGRMLVRPQGLYKPIAEDPSGAARIRAELNLPDGARLVLGIGHADFGKGFDLFLQLGELLRRGGHDEVQLCWIGTWDVDMRADLEEGIVALEASGRFHLPGRRDDVGAFLNAADALVLTSRQDSFPSVALEALAAGLPTIAFDRSGGIPDLLRETGVGHVVPHGDVAAMADSLVTALHDETPELSAVRRQLIAERFDWLSYVWDLRRLSLP